MREYNVSVIPYTLRFGKPAGTSRGVFHVRKVWYILVRPADGSGRWGIGECAPLPGLSCDASPRYEFVLGSFCKELQETGTIDKEKLRPYPSIAFGVETALLHLRRESFALYDTPFSRGEAGIPVNGLVWMGDYKSMLSQVEDKLRAGFRCVKLKIGAINFEDEINLIRYVRKHFTAREVELRVDANGAFLPHEAMDKLSRLAELDVHSIEQPLPAGLRKETARLAEESPLPIALDEELTGIGSIAEKQRLLDTIRPHYLVLKPSLHGGMEGCEEWIAEAEKRNIGWWITSALESNIGLNAIAQWTARFGNPLPQGLGTGQLFTNNTDMPLLLKGESLWYDARESPPRLPGRVGSGYTLSVNGERYTKDNLSALVQDNPRPVFRELYNFLHEWFDESPCITVQTSGSTGLPGKIKAGKEQMIQSARYTCDYFHLQAGDRALLCLPLKYIAGKMMVVRALVAGLDLIVVEPSGHPLKEAEGELKFAAMTPMQVYNTLREPSQAGLLKSIDTLIIGGSPVGDALREELKAFPNAVYSTYGMTETLSHIALCRLSGREASDYYVPFPWVGLSVSEDDCLVIDAPLIADKTLRTNDMAGLLPDGRFRIPGRKGNVINSGGIKLHAEEIEKKLQEYIPGRFAITSVPDEKMGEAIVLLAEHPPGDGTLDCLDRYEQPIHIFEIKPLPTAGNGKTDRKACREAAGRLVNDKNNYKK